MIGLTNHTEEFKKNVFSSAGDQTQGLAHVKQAIYHRVTSSALNLNSEG
jgi:hypothetical protein